jgi:hypothetical protein
MELSERSYGGWRIPPTTPPADVLRSLRLRRAPMHSQQAQRPKEKRMEITEVPTWLTWIAAGAAGVFVIAAIARTLEALLDLDPS